MKHWFSTGIIVAIISEVMFLYYGSYYYYGVNIYIISAMHLIGGFAVGAIFSLLLHHKKKSNYHNW